MTTHEGPLPNIRDVRKKVLVIDSCRDCRLNDGDICQLSGSEITGPGIPDNCPLEDA